MLSSCQSTPPANLRRGNRPDCIAETTITSVSIVTRIFTVAALAAVPFMNMIFLVGKSDLIKIANLLCCVCKLIWSCHSSRMDGELSHEAMGNFPGESSYIAVFNSVVVGNCNDGHRMTWS